MIGDDGPMNRRTTYRAERERAIEVLKPTVGKYRAALRRQEDYMVDEEAASLLAAYVPAQMALLQLIKETEDSNNE